MNRYSKVFTPVFIILPWLVFILFLLALLGLFIARSTISNEAGTPVQYSYKIVNTFPHDPDAFTQGLVYENGFLYEGTGLEGHSSLRRVEMETGKVLQNYKLPDEFFGEGITIFENQIIQLTYQSNVGFVYDRETFQKLRDFNYPTEGWGLTHDGEYLIMSDGTSFLYFLDPQTFKQTSRIMVHDKDIPLQWLNELEYIDGMVYANVWLTDRIAMIAPETGQVAGWINLAGLLKPQDYSGQVDVLNGIAYDADNNRLFVTGKLWPKLFEIKLIPAK